jgi:hypothetical protein
MYQLVDDIDLQILWSRIWTTDANKKTGSFQVNNFGQDLTQRNQYVTPELKTAIWNHAVEITGEGAEATANTSS